MGDLSIEPKFYKKLGEEHMLIKEGMEISTIDVNGNPCIGKVVCFLKNTFIIERETEYGIDRYLVLKDKFRKKGYTFPKYNAVSYYN